MNKRIIITSLVLFILAIILGAFGAHALKKNLSIEQLNSYEVGVRYQFYQAVALLIIGFNAEKLNFPLNRFLLFSILGILFFSGSIYLLSIASIFNWNKAFIGPITPIGGLILILNWSFLLYKIRKN
ncbi:MAG: DUF423 domain-containing protein [Flavobacteriales bacterium]|nr:DUF423 domain-containing protein [Flavobacteriales bacterium]